MNILGAVLQLNGDQTQFETHILRFSITNTNLVPYLFSNIAFQNSAAAHHSGHIYSLWSPVRPQKDQLVENRYMGSTVSVDHTVVPWHIKHRTLTTVTAAQSPLCPVGFLCILTGHSLLNHKTSRLQERKWIVEVIATLCKITLGEPGNGRTEPHCKRPPPTLPLCCH